MFDGMTVVDTHHHFLPEEVLSDLRKMAGGKPRLVNDRISITLNPDLSDADAHLEAMNGAGVDVAVLTNSGVSVLGTGTCRMVNEGLAELERTHPERFVASAHVDIDDENAAAELERCVSQFSSRVVALPCSSPERDLDDPSLDPLWAAICELELPVILHPANLPRGASLDYGLERSCARPFDTTQAGVRLICGVLPRFPKLRFVLPHCGGTAPFLKGRLSMFFNPPGEHSDRQLPRTQREQQAEGIDRVFDELWSKLYFDTAGTGGWAPIVSYTASVVTADQMVFGTDYPLESHSAETMRELVEMIGDLDCPAEDRHRIASGTALKLLGESLSLSGTLSE